MTLTDDTQVALMLVSGLGAPRAQDVPVLRQSEFVSLALTLKQAGMSLGGLLEDSDVERLRELGIGSPERVSGLLHRGGALAIALDNWTSAGIWVIGWDDPAYPDRYKEKLKGSAPAVLFGVGDKELLSNGGLAIVGSRNVDEDGMAFTRRLAERCASEGIQVVSGGAKGVDATAMLSCLNGGGKTVGVVSDSLARNAVSAQCRDPLGDGKLTLISMVDPSAGFSVGNAMARNKLIYALADYAVVVSSARKEGGTWAGAVENLSKRWTPLLVRSGAGVPDGNTALIGSGGAPLEAETPAADGDLLSLLADLTANARPPDHTSDQPVLPL